MRGGGCSEKRVVAVVAVAVTAARCRRALVMARHHKEVSESVSTVVIMFRRAYGAPVESERLEVAAGRAAGTETSHASRGSRARGRGRIAVAVVLLALSGAWLVFARPSSRTAAARIAPSPTSAKVHASGVHVEEWRLALPDAVGPLPNRIGCDDRGASGRARVRARSARRTRLVAAREPAGRQRSLPMPARVGARRDVVDR